MRNVIILGTGGCASEVTFYIEDNNLRLPESEKINILGYIDYADHVKDHYDKYDFKAPVLCDIDSYEPKPNEEVLLAVMDIGFRRKMIDALKSKNAKIGSFFHHTVVKPEELTIGEGNIAGPFCMLEKYATIGNYNLLTSYSCISHDAIVGDNNFLSVAVIAGSVKVGDNNYFGIRSFATPGIEIGNNNVIQAGMMVDKSIKDDTTVFYRFKEKIMAIPKMK
jgi:acetyltransferase-like isoleucine patch superfamily enzyme